MKITKVISIIALSFLLFWFLKEIFFKNAQDEIISNDEITDTVTEKVQSFSLQGFSETGEMIWQIEGRSADIYSEIIDLTGINADSYGKDITVNLKSDKGVFNRKTNNIQLKQNVVVVTSDGGRLTTESLSWDAEKELISTQEYVRIEHQEMDATGLGAQAKPNLKKAQLNRDVRVNIKKPPTVITCGGPLEIDYSNNIAYFNDNVNLDDNKARISTDKAIAYFNPEQRSLTRVLCEGNVRIVRGDDITYSDSLIYLPDEGKVILKGRPQIIIGFVDEMLREAK